MCPSAAECANSSRQERLCANVCVYVCRENASSIEFRKKGGLFYGKTKQKLKRDRFEMQMAARGRCAVWK